MREIGHGRAHAHADQRAIDVDLARGVVDVIVAAHHVGDAHVQIVHHHREVVRRIAIGTEDHQIIEFGIRELDAALHLVVPRHCAVERVLEADYAIGHVAVTGVLFAIGAVVARLFFRGERGLTNRIEFLAGLVGVVRGASGDHLLGDFAVAVETLGLVDRTFVVAQAQPVHRFQDRVDRRLGAALAVGILDPQHELAARVARGQPAVQRGAGAADMQITGRAGSEAGADGHAEAAGNRKDGILPGMAGAFRLRHRQPRLSSRAAGEGPAFVRRRISGTAGPSPR